MMKNILIFLTFLCSLPVANSQSIASAPADKAVVYFVRYSGTGALINFTYFDGDNVIGKFNGPKYLRYECAPGEHLFWAQSENKSYLEADLEAGKIYVVNVLPVMGAFKAGVQLHPVAPNAIPRALTRLLSKKSSESFTADELNEIQEAKKEVLARGNEKQERMEERGKELKKLSADMAVDPKDLIFVKKSKKKS